MSEGKMLTEDVVAGFIGAGNIAEAVVRGLIRAGKPPSSIVVSDIRSERLGLFSSLGCAAFQSNLQTAQRAEVLVLSVKPQAMPDVLGELKGTVDEETLLVSIAAGVATGAIEASFDKPVRVVRVMPNTPLLVGKGVSVIVPGRNVRPDDADMVEEMFAASGKVVRTDDEAVMDAVTAVSGSGPAYVFYLAEAMVEAALEEGLPEDLAEILVRETIRGAGELLVKEEQTPPAELRKRVTSPGGTTQAAAEILDGAGAKELWVRAVRRAAERSRELGAG